jgi:DNA-binding transcriptional ArsR family regulator
VKALLYQPKAEFFKTLGHPARIRILELLSEHEHAIDLQAVAWLILSGVLPGQAELLQDLRRLRRLLTITQALAGFFLRHVAG